MAPYESESDDDGCTEDYEAPFEDRSLLKATTHSLGFTSDYVPDWTAQHAFREFYQNWSVFSLSHCVKVR
jgi:hypothetical protein